MWKILNKEVDLGKPTSFLDHENLRCTQIQWNKQIYCWQLQNHVWVQNFSKSNWKITMLGKCAYFLVVIWHGKSSEEMCGTILWVSKQNDSTTLQNVNSLHWRPSFQIRRIEIRGTLVKSMLSNRAELLILGTNWKTRYSTVSEQTCTIDYKMDQNLWATLQNNADWACCKTPILQEILSNQIYIKWNIVRFGKSYVCSNQLCV